MSVQVKDSYKRARNMYAWLKEKGYQPCNSSGLAIASDEINPGELGIIEQTVANKRTFLETIIRLSKPRRVFLGLIKHLNDSQIVTIEVYGHENQPTVIQIANDMSEHFNLSVNVELASEGVRLERLPTDPVQDM